MEILFFPSAYTVHIETLLHRLPSDYILILLLFIYLLISFISFPTFGSVNTVKNAQRRKEIYE